MISGIGDAQYLPCSIGPCNPPDAPRTAEANVRPQPNDSVHISAQARNQHSAKQTNHADPAAETNLTPEDKQEVEKLKKRDQEVKAHERAHMSAGSDIVVGGANYEYQRGPDGKMYAVGGEVKIDTSKENDPQATIRKMQKVKRAALAPAQPSATDRNVAAKASQMEMEARIELAKEKAESEDSDREETDGIHTNTNPIKNYNTSFQNIPNINVTA